MKWQSVDGRILHDSTTSVVLLAKPNMKSSRKPISKNFPAATKSKRRTHNGSCILFEGVLYQTLSSFAEEYSFCGGGANMKMAWFKQQLSKLPLKDCLRFLPSESLTSISRLVPKDLREGKVDVENKHEFFVQATRKVKTGNAGLFKSSVLSR